jgi:hypothetical protein
VNESEREKVMLESMSHDGESMSCCRALVLLERMSHVGEQESRWRKHVTL